MAKNAFNKENVAEFIGKYIDSYGACPSDVGMVDQHHGKNCTAAFRTEERCNKCIDVAIKNFTDTIGPAIWHESREHLMHMRKKKEIVAAIESGMFGSMSGIEALRWVMNNTVE